MRFSGIQTLWLIIKVWNGLRLNAKFQAAAMFPEMKL